MSRSHAPGEATEAGYLHRTMLGDHGPWVVLLHGLFGQGKNWTTVAKALRTRSRVVMVDLPNHGRSSWTERFSYPDMAAAVAGLVTELTSAAAEPVAVVGHSMGGKVAMTLALSRPELVDRLVAVDIAPVSYRGLSSFSDYIAGMRSLDLTTLTDRAAADHALQPYAPDAGVRSFLLQNLRRHGDPTGRGDGWRWQLNLDLLADQLPQLSGWPELEVPPYPGPVLWLAGGSSDYVKPEYAPAMRSLFPRAQLVTVKNTGHWVHAERPDIFVAAVDRFLHPEPGR